LEHFIDRYFDVLMLDCEGMLPWCTNTGDNDNYPSLAGIIPGIDEFGMYFALKEVVSKIRCHFSRAAV
jgi:hypothetical protein